MPGLVACAAPRRTWETKEADVVIIGAGLSGLHAAQILKNAGMKVLVVEGNDRTGGRVHTLYDLPGLPDLGGIQISGSTLQVTISHRRTAALKAS